MLKQAAVVRPDKLSLFRHHHNIQQLCAEHQTVAQVLKLPGEYGEKKKEKNISFSRSGGTTGMHSGSYQLLTL